MSEDPLSAFVTWVAGVLTGTMATAVAVSAVAGVGLLALTGRIAVRRALGVVLGCFVLFSAAAIARGLTDAAGRSSTVAAVAIAEPRYTPTVPEAVPYDPYAGASVPTARSGEDAGLIR